MYDGIERAALRLAPRARLLEKRLVAEEPDALLDRQVLAVQPDADDGAAQADQRFGELAEPDDRIAPAEALVDHHLLAVVRPAFDERRRREQDRLAQLRVDLAQVLVVEEVPREHLVNRDRPERAVVEVAQVLVLPLGRPRRIDVGDVVERAQRPRLERARASTCWRTSSDRTAASARPRPARRRGCVMMRCALDEVARARRAAAARPARAGRRRDDPALAFCQAAIGSPPLSREATRRNSSCVALQLAHRDRRAAGRRRA